MHAMHGIAESDYTCITFLSSLMMSMLLQQLARVAGGVIERGPSPACTNSAVCRHQKA